MALPIEIFADRGALMQAAAAKLGAALRAGLTARGAAAAALSGGTTPAPAYEKLAESPLDWPRVTFALVDERWVPPSDPSSNEGMLRRTLKPALEQGAALLPMWSKTPNHIAGAEAAEAAHAALNLDVALLGMGGDGHTASWFPGSPQLSEALNLASQRSMVAVEAPGAAGTSQRLTLSFAAVARARSLILLITGEDKRARLEEASRQQPHEAPIAAILRACADRLTILWAA
ncbi:MAG: 6-phosphogluconolactonase [Terricaulis sp.]